MLVMLCASRPAERMHAAAIPAEGTRGCKQGGGAASVDALLRMARECGERATIGSSSACRNARTDLLDALSSGHGDGPAVMAAAVAIARVASACVRAEIARKECKKTVKPHTRDQSQNWL
eukprot:6020104-Pleurochrysis_carterae.AAC.1